MIVAVPPLTPVTRPVEPTVAIKKSVVLQLPPPVPSCSNTVEDWQTGVFVVIAPGVRFTVTICVDWQPPGILYEIIEVPAATPVTRPSSEPTVAFAVLLLIQVPPVVASVRFVCSPAHTTAVPVIMPGAGLTVTSFVAEHPVLLIEYVIVAVPTVTPVTMPAPVPTVALPLLLVHVPPVAMSLRLVVPPWHTAAVPSMLPIGLTVAITVARQPSNVV